MDIQVSLLEKSFAIVAPKAEALVHDFYETLFRDYPAVKPLFEGVDRREQEKKLLGALTLVINNLRKPQVLLPALRELGARHVGYGALPSHYPAVGATLLKVLAYHVGSAWTPELEQAWTGAYDVIQETMLEGAARLEPSTAPLRGIE